MFRSVDHAPTRYMSVLEPRPSLEVPLTKSIPLGTPLQILHTMVLDNTIYLVRKIVKEYLANPLDLDFKITQDAFIYYA
jgi:hypothetical protein